MSTPCQPRTSTVGGGQEIILSLSNRNANILYCLYQKGRQTYYVMVFHEKIEISERLKEFKLVSTELRKTSHRRVTSFKVSTRARQKGTLDQKTDGVIALLYFFAMRLINFIQIAKSNKMYEYCLVSFSQEHGMYRDLGKEVAVEEQDFQSRGKYRSKI